MNFWEGWQDYPGEIEQSLSQLILLNYDDSSPLLCLTLISATGLIKAFSVADWQLPLSWVPTPATWEPCFLYLQFPLHNKLLSKTHSLWSVSFTLQIYEKRTRRPLNQWALCMIVDTWHPPSWAKAHVRQEERPLQNSSIPRISQIKMIVKYK